MEARTSAARRVMVVADPTRESADAIQYALSHVLVEQDELILFHVENQNSWRKSFASLIKRPSISSSMMTDSLSSSSEGAASPGLVDFLEEMKQTCEIAKPKLHVRVSKVPMEATFKAAVINSQIKVLGVDILIIGQRRSLSNAFLGRKWSGSYSRGSRGVDTAEYLIENSNCTCVGVQRKGQNAGYLLNTKTQKFLAPRIINSVLSIQVC